MNVNEQTRRVEALALLEDFTKRILPGARTVTLGTAAEVEAFLA